MSRTQAKDDLSTTTYGGEEKVEVKLSTTEGEKVVKYEDGVFYVDGVEMTEVKPGRGRG